MKREGAWRDKDGAAKCKEEAVTSIEGGQQGGVGDAPVDMTDHTAKTMV